MKVYTKGDTIGWHLARLKNGRLDFLGLAIADEHEIKRRADVMNSSTTDAIYFPVVVLAGADVVEKELV